MGRTLPAELRPSCSSAETIIFIMENEPESLEGMQLLLAAGPIVVVTNNAERDCAKDVGIAEAQVPLGVHAICSSRI